MMVSRAGRQALFYILLAVSPLLLAQEKKTTPKAWLGISFIDVPGNRLPKAFAKQAFTLGLQVQQVFPKTSADQAGLQPGDFLLKINGTPIASRMAIVDSIGKREVGETITLTIGRKDSLFQQVMALSPRPEDMQAITQLLIGSQAPKLQGNFYQGSPGTLASLKGKIVLLDFWATWCGPCRITLPTLNEVYREFKDKGLVIIGVSSEPLETLKDFQKSTPLDYPLFHDVSRLTQNKYNAYAYPTLVYIDKAGVVQRMETGAHPKSHIVQRIQELLNSK